MDRPFRIGQMAFYYVQQGNKAKRIDCMITEAFYQEEKYKRKAGWRLMTLSVDIDGEKIYKEKALETITLI